MRAASAELSGRAAACSRCTRAACRASGAAAASLVPRGPSQVEDRRARCRGTACPRNTRACSRWTSSSPRRSARRADRASPRSRAGSGSRCPGRSSPTTPCRDCPRGCVPEFIISIAEPWIGMSAVIEWRKAMSSTCWATLREQVADPLAALAVLLKVPARLDDAADVLDARRGRRSCTFDGLVVACPSSSACNRTCRSGSARRT